MNTTNIFWEEKTEIIWPDNNQTETSNLSTIEQDSTWHDAWQDIEEVIELEPIDDISQHLLSDETLAEGLNDICMNATKSVSDRFWDRDEVPDYPTRLWWIKMSLQLKWHFREKAKRNWLVDSIYQYKLK